MTEELMIINHSTLLPRDDGWPLCKPWYEEGQTPTLPFSFPRFIPKCVWSYSFQLVLGLCFPGLFYSIAFTFSPSTDVFQSTYNFSQMSLPQNIWPSCHFSQHPISKLSHSTLPESISSYCLHFCHVSKLVSASFFTILLSQFSQDYLFSKMRYHTLRRGLS
jgi:hypothetical protein